MKKSALRAKNFKIQFFWIKNIKFHYLILFLILCIAIFFRFYNTPNRYGFDNDPTRDILVVRYAVTHLAVPLRGAISGIASFTFGPWYYYQLIIFQMLFPFSYSPWIYVGMASVMAVFFMYKIGENLEGKRFGLLLAFLMAITPSEIGQSQGLSNPSLVPLFSTIIIWIFVRILSKKFSYWWIFIWGLFLGIGINIHYQVVCLSILPILFFALKREKFFIKVLLFLVGLFMAFLPFFIFNIENHWDMVSDVIYYITTGRHGIYIPNSWKIYLFNFWLPYASYILGISLIATILVVLFTAGEFVVQYVQKRLKFIYLLLLIAFLFDFIFLRYFLSQRDYYYYLFLHPFIFIFFGFAICQFQKTKIGIILSALILVILTVGMTKQDVFGLSSRQDQIAMQEQAAVLVKNYPHATFTIHICGETQRNAAQGIDFFLDNYKKLATDNTSVKIGLIDNSCSTKISYYPKIDNEDNMVNLDHTDNKILLKEGFKPITLETVYQDTVK